MQIAHAHFRRRIAQTFSQIALIDKSRATTNKYFMYSYLHVHSTPYIIDDDIEQHDNTLVNWTTVTVSVRVSHRLHTVAVRIAFLRCRTVRYCAVYDMLRFPVYILHFAIPHYTPAQIRSVNIVAK